MAKLNCSEQAIETLRFAVMQKHRKIYGALKQEVDQALTVHAKKILEEINKKNGGN